MQRLPERAYGWIFALSPSSLDLGSGADGTSDKCLLFTDAYGRLMQVVLALTALVIMYIKRKLETPMRPVRVWALDVGKQCCGAFLIHCLSILLSIVFVAEAANGDDECGIYFVTYMLDTTWGVVVLLVLLQIEHAIFERLLWRDLTESGFYGEPPQLIIWAKQLAAYAGAVLIMKVLDSLLILYFYHDIAAFATGLFRSFTHHRHLELLLVMIIIPGCCNSFQFWIVDSYLKCDGSHWKYFTALVTSDDEQPQGKPLIQRLVEDDLAKPQSSIIVGPQPVAVPDLKSVSYDTTLTPEDEATKTATTRPGQIL